MNRVGMFFSKIILKSSKSQIIELEKFIDTIMFDYNIEEQYRGIISIPLIESVENAIIHGNNNDASKNVVVIVQVKNSKLNFLVEDEGKGFDYQTIIKNSITENNTARGLQKIEKLVDNINFEKNGSSISYNVDVPFKIMPINRKNILKQAKTNVKIEQYV